MRNSSPNAKSSNSTSGTKKANVKPKSYDGSEDFGDYLSQFEIIADLNQWDYPTKSLQLASALTGQAVGIVNMKYMFYSTNFAVLDTCFGY